MQRRRIGKASDDSPKGIDFMHELTLGWPSHCGITRLPGNPIEVEGEQGSRKPQSCCCQRGFTTGVTTTDDDDVEVFGRGSTKGHGARDVLENSRNHQCIAALGRQVAEPCELGLEQ